MKHVKDAIKNTKGMMWEQTISFITNNGKHNSIKKKKCSLEFMVKKKIHVRNKIKKNNKPSYRP